MIPTLDAIAAKLFDTFIRSVEKHMANCENANEIDGSLCFELQSFRLSTK